MSVTKKLTRFSNDPGDSAQTDMNSRNSIQHFPGPLVCCSLALVLPFTVRISFARADLDAVIAGLQKRYAVIESVGAEFNQTYRAPDISQSESGTFVMKKPGLMRWDYQSPEAKLFVADGKETYLYTPADRQVLVRKFSAAELHGTPLQFLLGQGDIQRSFVSAWEQSDEPGANGAYLVRLTPRSADAEYAYFLIEFDARSYDIRSISIHERTGNISEFLIRNLKFNVKVDPKQFSFKIPKGVEVVRLDEK